MSRWRLDLCCSWCSCVWPSIARQLARRRLQRWFIRPAHPSSIGRRPKTKRAVCGKVPLSARSVSCRLSSLLPSRRLVARTSTACRASPVCRRTRRPSPLPARSVVDGLLVQSRPSGCLLPLSPGRKGLRSFAAWPLAYCCALQLWRTTSVCSDIRFMERSQTHQNRQGRITRR